MDFFLSQVYAKVLVFLKWSVKRSYVKIQPLARVAFQNP